MISAGIGLVASVTFSRAAVAERAVTGLIYASILVESVVVGTTLDAPGYCAGALLRPHERCVRWGEIALEQAVVLLDGVLGTVTVAVVIFQLRDIT